MPIDNTYLYKPYKSLVGTGKDEFDMLPPVSFKGAIIFCNGYNSAALGGALNAMYDHVPGENTGEWEGQNAHHDEYTAPSLQDKDIYTSQQANKELHLDKRSNENIIIKKMHTDSKTDFLLNLLAGDEMIKYYLNTQTEASDEFKMFYGYWNNAANHWNFTNIYSQYFNATGNDHYINGSHGMGSPANERIDHGILLGYEWATKNWGIYKKQIVDDNAKTTMSAFFNTATPPYKPVTIVGHSQGNATATGVALGILNYAAEIGWEKVPINLVLLSVHQPSAFYTETDHYKFWKEFKIGLDINVDKYKTIIGDDHNDQSPVTNKLTSLFDKDKRKNEYGIDEWMAAVSGDGWEQLKKHAVQFTFSNDRCDLVMNQGDIAGIANAREDGFNDNTVLGFDKYTPKHVPFVKTYYPGAQIYTLDDTKGFTDYTNIEFHPASYNQRIFALEETDANSMVPQPNNYHDGVNNFFKARRLYWQQYIDCKKIKLKNEANKAKESNKTAKENYNDRQELVEAKYKLNEKYTAMIYAYSNWQNAELDTHSATVAMAFRPHVFTDWAGSVMDGNKMITGKDRDGKALIDNPLLKKLNDMDGIEEGDCIWSRIVAIGYNKKSNEKSIFYRADVVYLRKGPKGTYKILNEKDDESKIKKVVTYNTQMMSTAFAKNIKQNTLNRIEKRSKKIRGQKEAEIKKIMDENHEEYEKILKEARRRFGDTTNSDPFESID